MDTRLLRHPARRKDAVSVRGLPGTNDSHGKPQDGNHLVPITFPATRSALWDPRRKGEPFHLHPAYYRNPVIVVEERPLRLAQRLAHNQSEESFTCTLHGSLSVDPDGEGVRILLERLDTATPDGHTPCELSLSTKVSKNTAQPPRCSAEDFSALINGLQQRCVIKDKVDLNHFVSLQASTSYCSNSDSHIFYIDLDVVLPAVTFKATPINSVPIVPTALSKNLSGPLSMSDVQGEPKSGYLTMDHTRKLLLVLESDPKIATLPIIGIWVSGVAMVHDPVVWASSIRYLHNTTMQDRVCKPPEPFLVVLYSPLHSKPEFFECLPTDNKSTLNFDLYTCHEVIKLPKDYPERPQSPLELELTLVENGSKRTVFESALEATKHFISANVPGRSPPADHLAGNLEEIMPRSIPKPHRDKVSSVEPSVPEVSLLFDENERLVEPQSQPAHPTPASGVARQKQQSKHKESSANDRLRGPLKTLNQDRSAAKVSASQASPAGPAHLHAGHQSSPYTPAASAPYPPGSTASPHFPTPPTTMSYHPSLGYVQNGSYGTPPGLPVHPNATWPQYPPAAPYSLPPGVPYPEYSPNSWPQAVGPRPMYMMPPQNVNSPPMPYNGYMQYPSPGMAQYGPAVAPYGPRHPSMPVAPAHQTPPRPPPVSEQPKSKSAFTASQPGIMPPLPVTSVGHVPAKSRAAPGNQRAADVKVSTSAQPSMPTAVSAGKVCSSASMNVGGSRQGNEHRQGVGNNGEVVPPSGPASLASEAPPEVYELLRQKDVQLNELRQQLDQLLSRQNDTPKPQVTAAPITAPAKQVCTTAVNTSLLWQGEAAETSHLSSYVQPVHSQGEPQQSRRSSYSRVAQSHPPHRNASPATRNSTPSHRSNHTSPQHTGAQPTQCCHPSPEQPDSDLGQRLSAESLCLGEIQLKQIQDRTSDSLSSDMVVDMPEYGSLSPDKSGLQTSSGFNDTERSPVLGESVSFYQNQINEQTAYSPRPGEESADTGLGDSHPDVELLQHNQKLFYQNLIGNVKKFLESHDESTMKHDISSLDQKNRTNEKLYLSNNHPENAFIQQQVHDQSNTSPAHDHSVKDFHQSHNQSNAVFHQSHNQSQEVFHQRRPDLNESRGQQHVGDKRTDRRPPQHQVVDRPLDDSSAQRTRKYDGEPHTPVHVSPKHACSTGKQYITEMEEVEEMDVAEETRRQLERMGIYLDSLGDHDNFSKEERSLFFDPAMLPKLNYVSMMLSDDSDLSADADALAMKYLGDSQLAELARLRLHSPQRKTRQDSALKHIMTGSVETPNISTFGLPANHMSFASRKFLERYGLTSGDSPAKMKMPSSPSTPAEHPRSDRKAEPEMMNVKQFLKQLADQSLSMREQEDLDGADDGKPGQVLSNLRRHSDCSCNCEMSAVRHGNQSISGSYRDICRHRRQDQRSVWSDTTMYHTPSRSPATRHKHDHSDISGHQKAASDHTPIRVFDTDFQQRMRQYTPKSGDGEKIEYGQFLGDIPHNVTHNTSSSSASNPNKRILDIERLRELPKLL